MCCGAWCRLRGVCCVIVVLFGGVCLLFVVFLLLDCRLQCIICGVLSGAAVMIVVWCKLYAACCDYCFLRLFAGCCLLCVVVSGVLLVVFKCVLVIVCCVLLAD